MGCSKYIIEMKHNPFAGQENIYFQKEEVTPFGCCFSPLYTQPHQSENPKPQRYRFHSEPKEPKNKKIDIITPKRGLSSPKDTYLSTPRTCSREKSISHAKVTSKEKDHQKLSLTLGTKMASIRTSRETSKVSFNRYMRIEYPTGECKRSWMTTRNSTKPLNTETNHFQTVQNQTSFAFISEISLVEEEFISQGSESLQALNFIAQLKGMDSQSSRQPSSTARMRTEKGTRLNQIPEMVNPFAKKMDQTDRITTNSRKKLIL